MQEFFALVLAIIAAILVAGVVYLTRGAAGRTGTVIAALAAITWAWYRASFVSFTMTIFRPLAGGWIVVPVLALLGVIALIALNRPRWADLADGKLPDGVVHALRYLNDPRSDRWAKRLAWTSLALAFLLPVFDLFSLPFWADWLQQEIWLEVLMLIGVGALTFLFAGMSTWLTKQAAWAPAALAGLVVGMLILIWAQYALIGKVGPAFVPVAPATPAASSTASASKTPVVVAARTFAVPSTSQVKNWKQFVDLTSREAGWFEAEVNRFAGELGFDWEDVEKMAAMPSDDARRLFTFGATKVQVTDEQATELAGMPPGTPVWRMDRCFTPLGQVKTCPVGDRRVVVILSPIRAKGDSVEFVPTGSGVAIIPGNDGSVTYALVKYQH